ncbi:MAG: metal-sensitive transcriptional regulator [Bacillota bacterium]
MPLMESHPQLYRELMNRMKRIEGQMRGVQRLLDEGAECEEIVIQISAMRAALSRVGMKLVTCQLGSRMAEELQEGGSGKASTDELMETFLRLQ